MLPSKAQQICLQPRTTSCQTRVFVQFQPKIPTKNFCVNARLTIATHSPFLELTKYTICHKLTKRDTHTIICPNDTPAKTCTTP